MIRFTVEIETVAKDGKVQGVGVHVKSVEATVLNTDDLASSLEGGALVGLGAAINEYLHSRGNTSFDMFKGSNLAGCTRYLISDGAKYRALRHPGICNGEHHLRIPDEIDTQLGEVLEKMERAKWQAN